MDLDAIPKGDIRRGVKEQENQPQTKDRYLSVLELLKRPQTIQIDTAENCSRCSHASHDNLRVAPRSVGTRPIVPAPAIWFRIISNTVRSRNYSFAFVPPLA